MKTFISLLLVFSIHSAMAQTVTGLVTDKETGKPLSEVLVLVVGTSAVAMTNPKGVYTIPAVDGNANLIFSLSDYSTQEIPAAKSNIDVALEKPTLVSYRPSAPTSNQANHAEKTKTAKPLYVVDGVTKKSEENPLDYINPDDIVNITVLKKKEAAEAYGSMGANGVILIKTQKQK